MSEANDALATIIERGRPAEESDALLAALVDGGVFVPVDSGGSVVVIGIDDSGPVLPAYTSDEVRARRLPDAAGSVRCDVHRLLDIAKHTGLETLVVFAGGLWVRVPMPLIATTLSLRGVRTQGDQTLRLTWSTDPVAVALRNAIGERILAHPQVETVWIGHARWAESGNEQLMLQMAVAAGARPAAQALLEQVLAEDVPVTDESPTIALIVLEPHESAQAARLDELGLDTVRADHAAGRVRIVSREFD